MSSLHNLDIRDEGDTFWTCVSIANARHSDSGVVHCIYILLNRGLEDSVFQLQYPAILANILLLFNVTIPPSTE